MVVGPDADAVGELGWELGGQRIRQRWSLEFCDGEDRDVFLIAAQQPEEHFFVFLQRERARRVHQGAAGAQHLVGSAQKALLLLGEVLGVLRRPVGEHVLVFAHDAVARARCIDEDAVEKVGEVARQHGPYGLGQDVIGHPTALQVAHESGHALALGFIN